MHQAQEEVGLKYNYLIAPVKIRVETIFVIFRVILDDILAIDHLYGNILKINKYIHSCLPLSEFWETVKMENLKMNDTLQSIKMNQFKYWFVSDAFHDTAIL